MYWPLAATYDAFTLAYVHQRSPRTARIFMGKAEQACLHALDAVRDASIIVRARHGVDTLPPDEVVDALGEACADTLSLSHGDLPHTVRIDGRRLIHLIVANVDWLCAALLNGMHHKVFAKSVDDYIKCARLTQRNPEEPRGTRYRNYDSSAIIDRILLWSRVGGALRRTKNAQESEETWFNSSESDAEKNWGGFVLGSMVIPWSEYWPDYVLRTRKLNHLQVSPSVRRILDSESTIQSQTYVFPIVPDFFVSADSDGFCTGTEDPITLGVIQEPCLFGKSRRTARCYEKKPLVKWLRRQRAEEQRTGIAGPSIPLTNERVPNIVEVIMQILTKCTQERPVNEGRSRSRSRHRSAR